MNKKDFYRYVFSQLKTYNIKVIDCKSDYDPTFEDYFVIGKDNYFTIYNFIFDKNNKRFNHIDILTSEQVATTKYQDIKQCLMYSEPIIKEVYSSPIQIKVASNNESINVFVDSIRKHIEMRIRFNTPRK